jgi:uncharacterized lipoprotein YbaY
MSPSVSGRIWFDDAAGQFTGATLRVKLQDVSRVDAPAREICNLVIFDCSYFPGEPPVDFILSTGPIELVGHYEVRVHLDLDGTGEYNVGDQITTQSYPVLTQGHPNNVQIHLKQISGSVPPV